MNKIFEKFSRTVAASPDKQILSLRPDGAWTTAAELLSRSRDLSSRLENLGVQESLGVMLRAGNIEEFVVAMLAVWKIGGVVIPIDPDLGEAELRRIRGTFSAVVEVHGEAGKLRIVPCPETSSPGKFPGTAIIRLTSGSTGVPRGALISADALLADGRAICSKMGIRAEDTNIGVIPLSHSYGFDNLVMPLLIQGTPLILLDAPLPGLILKALDSSRPLILPLVPYLVDLLARVEGESLPAGSGLRLVISAGAPLPPRVARRFQQKFGVVVKTFYGASEAGGITFNAGDDDSILEGCVGTPLPGVKIEIEPIDELEGADLSRGQGRIVIRGDAVGTGYYPAPDACFLEGVFKTMDLGSIDSKGRLHLKGSLSSLVNISGRKVNPLEVEQALMALDQVSDAAVLGFTDPLRGERIEAWVVTELGAAAASIKEALSSSLSSHKIPRSIHLVREIPRTSRGKLDRVRLQPDR